MLVLESLFVGAFAFVGGFLRLNGGVRAFDDRFVFDIDPVFLCEGEYRVKGFYAFVGFGENAFVERFPLVRRDEFVGNLEPCVFLSFVESLQRKVAPCFICYAVSAAIHYDRGFLL